ncbi:MAG: biopolymer transporter ExbD [Gammaproteobacteria bacterium]|nr:biopolymer transporter ExbD [Gammaproteobacteria bacterium]
MKSSRRLKRMSKKRLKLTTKMNLTSLMDVFTILVFFLLVNSGSADTLETPKEVQLPESKVESKPRETVVIFVGKEQVVVQGEPVALVADILESKGENIEPIMAQLAMIKENVIGTSTLQVSESQEVTILADRSVPFSVVKQIMSTCTSQGYGHISLAVIQKDAQISQI